MHNLAKASRRKSPGGRFVTSSADDAGSTSIFWPMTDSQANSLAVPSGNCWHAVVAASRLVVTQWLNNIKIISSRRVSSSKNSAIATALGTSVLACLIIESTSIEFLESDSGWDFNQLIAASGCLSI